MGLVRGDPKYSIPGHVETHTGLPVDRHLRAEDQAASPEPCVEIPRKI